MVSLLHSPLEVKCYLHVWVIFFIFKKANPDLSAHEHNWPVLRYVTHKVDKAFTKCIFFSFSTCILFFKPGFMEWLLWWQSISALGVLFLCLGVLGTAYKHRNN